MNCLNCIHFKECEGKNKYQKELANGTVGCLDGEYVLKEKDIFHRDIVVVSPHIFEKATVSNTDMHILTAEEIPSMFSSGLPPKFPEYKHLFITKTKL